MSPRLLVPVVALAVVTAGSARADRLAGSKLKLKLRLPEAVGDTTFIEPTAEYQSDYFNFARCMCDADTTAKEYEVEYTWDPSQTTMTTEPLHVWAGLNCDSTDETTRSANCKDLETLPAGNIPAGGTRRTYDTRQLVLKPGEMSCPNESRTVQHWIVTQNGTVWDADNRYGLFASAYTADMESPPLPTAFALKPRENGIVLSWTPPTSTADIEYYQVLCANADGTKVRSGEARYETPESLCAASYVPPNPPIVFTPPLAGMAGTLPADLEALDTGYVCATAAGTASSITVEDLVNGQAYWVVLVAVDKAKNVSATHIDRAITPQSVIDFWEELNDEDPALQGGLCVAQVSAGGGLGSLAVIGLATLVAVRRRRRARRAGRAARWLTLSLVVLAPAVASAQAAYSPYWEADPEDDGGIPEVTWTAGVRLGPYVPSIDSKFDSSPGPYARTFKNDSVLFAVDVHRVWSLSWGQIGVGGTLGYYSNSTNAWQEGSNPSDPMRPRAKGNLTRLSIAPTALTAIYRATIFDDQWGVPLVPYVRGGVGYYVWWIKTPADELSHDMTTGSDDRALGASIGLVGAAGLSIRAERIDPDAASSMKNSGLEHAGFFAEVELGWVDGFGDATKLSVGDTTWFGGLSFEF